MDSRKNSKTFEVFVEKNYIFCSPCFGLSAYLLNYLRIKMGRFVSFICTLICEMAGGCGVRVKAQLDFWNIDELMLGKPVLKDTRI